MPLVLLRSVGPSNIWQTWCSNMESWNFLFPLFMCVVLNLDIYITKNQPGLKICTLVSQDGCWSVQLPCFSQLPSQSLLLPVRRVLAWCCCVVSSRLLLGLTFGLPLVIFSYCVWDVGFSSMINTGIQVLTKTLNVAFGWRLPNCGVQCVAFYCT